MNILITGSEGVIGRRLLLWLIASRDHLLHTTDRQPSDYGAHTIADITHPSTLRRAFTASEPAVVFHLAASVGRRASEAYATVALRANVEGTQNVVDLCLEHGARLVYVSTSEVYGDWFLDGTPVHEELEMGVMDMGMGSPAYQKGIYGLSKWLGEEVVCLANDRYGLKIVIARPFMCYSEDEPLSPYRSAIARMMRAIVRGEPISVHRGAVRSWCYVDDMVEGLARLGLSDCVGIYNVGRDDPMTMGEAARLFATETAHTAGIEIVPMPSGIYPVKHASFDKIKRDVGWEAGIDLAEGLRRVRAHHMPLYARFEVR